MDDKKTMFALSYMKKGIAALWKKSFWKKQVGDPNLGTWVAFKATLTDSFAPANKEGDASTKMQTAQMSGMTADEFIEELKNWAAQSGMTQDQCLIEWCMAALPTTLHDKASLFDSNWRKFKVITTQNI